MSTMRERLMTLFEEAGVVNQSDNGIMLYADNDMSDKVPITTDLWHMPSVSFEFNEDGNLVGISVRE